MRCRILAVDDELHILKLLERVITEKTPHHITTTNNSLEIPDILGREQFDFVITDLRMPGMSGFDILKWIKDNDRMEEVIVITAFGSPETADEVLSLGAFDYLVKPFRQERILFSVNQAIRFRELKQDMRRLVSPYEQEPFEAAVRAFQSEYTKRLAARLDRDMKVVAERSGLDEKVIMDAIRDSEPDDL